MTRISTPSDLRSLGDSRDTSALLLEILVPDGVRDVAPTPPNGVERDEGFLEPRQEPRRGVTTSPQQPRHRPTSP
jgi:hypothetical protein